ncbi:MAG: hypothetical protein XD63_1427 [Thermoanaerobacterales bacterium 50_218]|nr:MAG: hypothetical protein XD63_1427 [Thermoanaerobacterales bacterium 50_218]
MNVLKSTNVARRCFCLSLIPQGLEFVDIMVGNMGIDLQKFVHSDLGDIRNAYMNELAEMT